MSAPSPAAVDHSPLQMEAFGIGSLARTAVHINLLQVWQTLARLVQMPVVISAVGLDGYGVWVMLYSLCSYPPLLSLGVVTAYVKFTAELDARGDVRTLSEVISTGVALTTCMSFAALLVLWMVRRTVLPLLGVAAPMLPQADVTLALLGAAVLIEAAGGWGIHALAGLQRTDLQYRLLTIGSMLEFAVSVALLLAGLGIVALALGVVMNRVFCAGASRLLTRRQRPALQISAQRVSVGGARLLLSAGLGFSSIAVLTMATRETVRLAISALFGSAALGGYQLADRLLAMAGTPAHGLLSPLMPAFANLRGREDRAGVEQLAVIGTRWVAPIAALPIGFAALFADPILFVWTGQHYPQAVWSTHLLAIGELSAALAGVRLAALRASAVFEPEIRYRSLEAVATLAGMAVGAVVAGYAVAVVAVTAARSGAALWFMRRQPSADHAPIVNAGGLIAPLSGVLVALIAVYGLAELPFFAALASASRLHGFLAVLGLAATSAGIAAVLTWLPVRLKGR